MLLRLQGFGRIPGQVLRIRKTLRAGLRGPGSIATPLGDLRCPRQGDTAGLWVALPPGRVATRKRRKPQYSNIHQSDETRSNLNQPIHKPTHFVSNTFQGRQMLHTSHSTCGQWQRRGRARKGAMVYVDSFRHMIYNTLWTSNRLIKYILYKYISYCTCRPLVHPL